MLESGRTADQLVDRNFPRRVPFGRVKRRGRERLAKGNCIHWHPAEAVATLKDSHERSQPYAA